MTILLLLLTIVLLSMIAILAVIFIDAYKIFKVNNKEVVDIDILKFDKCILPYK